MGVWLRGLLVLSMWFGLAVGCTPASDRPALAPSGTGGAAGLRVGLLTNGSLADSGWNALAGQALEQLGTELGATTRHQSDAPARAEEALRGFARDGCSLVFAHGNEFGDAALRVATEYPGTTFIVSSGEVEAPNVASLRFDLGEASYLAGMVAASLSRSGKAGQIGGESFPAVVQGFELFEKGARTINPSFTTQTTYLGNWHDANAAKEMAWTMIRGGADVIFQNADAAGLGVFQAAEEAGEREVYVVGSNADQNHIKPDLTPASAVLDVPAAFLRVAREVQQETFRGGTYLEDMRSGSVYLKINERFEDRLPADLRAKLAQVEQEIREGRLELIEK
jgi:basic membrane protein A and related proteins